MSRLLDHAVALLIDELRQNVPAALVAADLERHGLPLEDPAALRAELVDRRWGEMVDGFIGKTIPSQRGRKPNPILRTAILASAFYAQPRDGRRKTAAKGAAASLLGVTSAKVDKAVRSMERAIGDGDALSAAVLAAARRVLPIAEAEFARSEAAEADVRRQRRHAKPHFLAPFSARTAGQ